MGNKRNISFADPFFLLQAHSVFITIITLILAKHSYTWCSDKSVITQGHHLHHIKVSCLGTNDYKKKQVMICFTIHSTHTFKRHFCFRYWCQLGGECFSNLCPLTVWRPVCVCVCVSTQVGSVLTHWKCFSWHVVTHLSGVYQRNSALKSVLQQIYKWQFDSWNESEFACWSTTSKS